jgi:PKHD-type hydroxylase
MWRDTHRGISTCTYAGIKSFTCELSSELMEARTLDQYHQVVIDARKRLEGRTDYFITCPPCLNEGQRNEIKAWADDHPAPAEVVEAGSAIGLNRPKSRRTNVAWLDFQEYDWVYKIMDRSALKANEYFQADIVPVRYPIQIGIYDASEQGYFTWHSDNVASDQTRKITLVVPLNDPTEFEGGAIEFMPGDAIITPPQVPGVPIAFPSWLIHRVTPVTSGKRYSLVYWIRGPNWR